MTEIASGELLSDIAKVVNGKTIKNVLYYSPNMNDYLSFVFTDGTNLKLRVDWIYDWVLDDEKIIIAGENNG